MGKTLFLECKYGISGDMTVGALLALGADREKVTERLKSLPLEGFDTKISEIEKNGVQCTDYDVILEDEYDNHDHDMDYLYGHDDDEPLAINENGVVNMTHHHHDHGTHDHHRTLDDIISIINKSEVSLKAKNLAGKVFNILAKAESKAHGIPVEKVTFHEIGAVDSIVDILAAAICIDDLDISKTFVSRLNDGCGTIRTQHGILPVPVPAVKIISNEYSLPLCVTDKKGEMVTPTGAAVVAAMRTDDNLPATYKVLREGYGAGKRKYEEGGFLKAMIIK